MKVSYHWLLVLAFPAIITGCNPSDGSDSITSHPSYPSVSGCIARCHNAQSAISPDPLITNGSGTDGKHVIHVSGRGIPCEQCHFHYENSVTHADGQLDSGKPSVTIVIFDSTKNPGGTWNVTSGACSSIACHGPATLDWYGSDSIECTTCHLFAVGTARRQIGGAGGDFGQNGALLSHHIAGGSDPTRGQCLVCHDHSTHTGGTVRLKNADTGAGIIYDPAAPPSLEPFCLSCHDADGAVSTFAAGGSALSPFNDGSAPRDSFYPNATRIAASWSKSYGHGPNGNHSADRKLTCMGNGQQGTGCHGNNGTINAHGSVNQVLATRGFRYNISSNSYSEAYFELCFTCHTNYAGVTKEDTFGVKAGGILDGSYGPSGGPHGTNPPYYTSGVTTHFADHNETGSPLNDPPFGLYSNMNLHWFHIGKPFSSFRVGGVYFGIVCINCHDVHGSNTASGAVYDEMGYGNLAFGVDVVGQMSAQAYSDPDYLANNPTYCAFNCHQVLGTTKAWFYPITE